MNDIVLVTGVVSASAATSEQGTLRLPVDLPRVTLAGAAAGAINAALCLFRWPVPVAERAATFGWHVVPAGLVHGALLAGGAGLAAWLASRLTSVVVRLEAAAMAGWLSGYLSWIPLDMSVFGRPWPQAIVWPAAVSLTNAIWLPFVYFGSVTTLLTGVLLAVNGHAPRWMIIASSVGAGVLGSLPWWVEWGPWYFSLLHGGLWGTLVGWALSARASQKERQLI